MELQLHYDYTLKVLEKKAKAYKTAFLEQRDLRRRQEKALTEYEYVIDCMANRKHDQKGAPQQAEKANSIYEQLLLRIKAEYERELNELKAGATGGKEERSMSPLSPDQLQTTPEPIKFKGDHQD